VFYSDAADGELSVIQNPQDLLERAMEMPSSERGRLAALLIESLETDRDDDVDEAWADEVQRRLKEIDDGRVSLIPWSAVSRRMSDSNDTVH
jgi:putative addiction module component (TIGR02574 family)